MKRGVFTFCCLGALMAFVPASRGIVSDAPASAPLQADVDSGQPYSAIWTRNAFDLRPPEDKSAKMTNEVAPPSNIKLVGIYTIFGKRALLSMQEQNTGKGAPANKEEYYNMSEGERHGMLELVEINPSARTVKIKNNGIESSLTFETNRPPAPMASGGPRPNGMGGGIPGYTPPMNTVPNNGNSVPLPTRNIRTSSPNLFNNQPNYSSTGYSSGYVQPAAGLSIPGSTGTGSSLFSPAQTAPSAPSAPASNLTPEQQALMMIGQSMEWQQKGINGPPLPPSLQNLVTPPTPGGRH